MKKLLLGAAVLFVLAACSSKGITPMSQLDTKIATVPELQHHDYQLVSVNGKVFEAGKNEAAPTIAFSQDMRVTGTMCNNFFGQATLSNRGILRAQGVGMTRMLCTDPLLNQLDGDIAQLLENGAEAIVSTDGQFLRLSNTTTQLEFKLVDKVK